jgi:hypothetical protein
VPEPPAAKAEPPEIGTLSLEATAKAIIAQQAEQIAALEDTLNTCEIHADVENIKHRTACAVCLTEALEQIAALEAEAKGGSNEGS